jgi:kynurenine formamidase
MNNQLSNWGRWGPADERGTLNLLTPTLVKQAASLVRRGQVYSLAMPLAAEGPQWPSRHKTWQVTRYSNDPADSGSADDIVTMHSHSGTHMDALCHVWYHNQLYNGYDVPEHISSEGAGRNAIDNVAAIAGRGILLDVATWKGVDHLAVGEAISATDLEQCAASQGVRPQAGDILLVRTGWIQVFMRDRAQYNSGEPGLDLSTPAWLHRHDIVAIGADNQAIEVMSEIPPLAGVPFHRVVIRDLGLYLLENLNLEVLAADRCYEFLFVVAPLPLTGGVGSPINPVAIA